MATDQISIERSDFFDLIRVAVLSAKANTNCEPFLLYRGLPNRETRWLESRGVGVIHHSLYVGEIIKERMIGVYDQNFMEGRISAFMRYDLPHVVRELGFEDEYILYTDCDVVFLKDVDLGRVRPKLVAAVGGKEGGRTPFKFGGWMHYNSGVLLMNVSNFAAIIKDFFDFVLANGRFIKRPKSEYWRKNLLLSDQVALNLFLGNKFDRLPKVYNWNPRDGISDEVGILHFNGLKWNQWKDYLDGNMGKRQLDKYATIVNRNLESYEHYVSLASKFVANNEASIDV